MNLRTVTATLSSAAGLTKIGWVHVVALVAFLIEAITTLVTLLLIKHGRPEAVTVRFNRRVMVAVVVGFVVANAGLIGWAASMG